MSWWWSPVPVERSEERFEGEPVDRAIVAVVAVMLLLALVVLALVLFTRVG